MTKLMVLIFSTMLGITLWTTAIHAETIPATGEKTQNPKHGTNEVDRLIAENNRLLLTTFGKALKYRLGYTHLVMSDAERKPFKTLCESWANALHHEQHRVSPPPEPVAQIRANDVSSYFANALAKRYPSCRSSRFLDDLESEQKSFRRTSVDRNVYQGAAWIAEATPFGWGLYFGSRTCPEDMTWVGSMQPNVYPGGVPTLWAPYQSTLKGGLLVIDGEPVFYEYGYNPKRSLQKFGMKKRELFARNEVNFFADNIPGPDEWFVRLSSPTRNQAIPPMVSGNNWEGITSTSSGGTFEAITTTCLILFRKN